MNDPVCATCGATPSPDDRNRVLLTWSRATERGREVWTCPDCARGNLRGIEGKLDSDWW